MPGRLHGRCVNCKGIRSELKLYGSDGNERQASICLYDEKCTLLDPDPPLQLTAAYGPIRATFTEASASIIVRSEHQFTGHDDYRLTQRRHYRRLASTSIAFVASDREALPFEHLKDLGEYIGFIDIRPEHIATPIAMALLAPPGHMRIAGRLTIMVGDYGPYFGAHSFPCTVYCMHDPKEGGTVCAHASIMMALGMMLDRGASLDGPFALHYLAHVFRNYRERSPRQSDGNIGIPRELLDPDRDVEDVLGDLGWLDPNPPSADSAANAMSGLSRIASLATEWDRSGCLGNRSAGDLRPAPIRRISLGGLSPWTDVSPLLTRFGVSNVVTEWPPDLGVDTNVLFIRLIEAYVVARCPVLLFVDSRTLWDNRGKTEGHAVVVVGISVADDFSKSTLIIHDPGEKPFAVHPAERCLRAMSAYPLKTSSTGKKTCVLYVGDRSIGTHAIDCVKDLLSREPEARTILRSAAYNIRLVDKLDVWNVYLANIDLLALRDRITSLLPHSRYWCIEATLGDGNRYVWLYDAHATSVKSLGRLHVRDNARRAGQRVEFRAAD